jgi:hypothetical protein
MRSRSPDKTCFVLMPFREGLREIYTDVYVPVCQQNNIRCWRVDEIARPGSITRDIVEGILDADLILADLTGRNPNVFYELGISHATGNKTIMTAQSRDDVPFDIASYRVIFYDHTLRGCDKLRSQLDLAVKELVTALHRTNNPFQEVVASRGGMRQTGRQLLIKAVNTYHLTRALKDLIKERNILYLDDLRNIELPELLKRPGFGKTSLSQLCSVLLRYDLFEEPEWINSFIVENALDIHSHGIGPYRMDEIDLSEALRKVD